MKLLYYVILVNTFLYALHDARIDIMSELESGAFSGYQWHPCSHNWQHNLSAEDKEVLLQKGIINEACECLHQELLNKYFNQKKKQQSSK